VFISEVKWGGTLVDRLAFSREDEDSRKGFTISKSGYFRPPLITRLCKLGSIDDVLICFLFKISLLKK